MPRIRPFEPKCRIGYSFNMAQKRVCLTCKNKGCIKLCRFQQQALESSKLVPLKG